MRTLTTLAALALLGSPALAAEPIKTLAKPAGKSVTVAELGDLLDVMGYNPKPYKNKDDQVVGYDLDFRSGEWTIRFSVEVSKDRSQIWFEAGLVSFLDKGPPSAEALLEVLADNNDLWPAYVYYSKKSKRLLLTQPNANRDVTPAALRTKIEGFAESIKKTITTYNRATEASGSDAPTADRRKIE